MECKRVKWRRGTKAREEAREERRLKTERSRETKEEGRERKRKGTGSKNTQVNHKGATRVQRKEQRWK